MNHPKFRIAICWLGIAGAAAIAADRPNIIFIMVDDMGYYDLGCYGSETILTPNLDRLARGGLRFTQFYNAGRCCPTRASLITGLHPHQVGIGHMTEPPGQPLYPQRVVDFPHAVDLILVVGQTVKLDGIIQTPLNHKVGNQLGVDTLAFGIEANR